MSTVFLISISLLLPLSVFPLSPLSWNVQPLEIYQQFFTLLISSIITQLCLQNYIVMTSNRPGYPGGRPGGCNFLGFV